MKSRSEKKRMLAQAAIDERPMSIAALEQVERYLVSLGPKHNDEEAVRLAVSIANVRRALAYLRLK